MFRFRVGGGLSRRRRRERSATRQGRTVQSATHSPSVDLCQGLFLVGDPVPQVCEKRSTLSGVGEMASPPNLANELFGEDCSQLWLADSDAAVLGELQSKPCEGRRRTPWSGARTAFRTKVCDAQVKAKARAPPAGAAVWMHRRISTSEKFASSKSSERAPSDHRRTFSSSTNRPSARSLSSVLLEGSFAIGDQDRARCNTRRRREYHCAALRLVHAADVGH